MSNAMKLVAAAAAVVLVGVIGVNLPPGTARTSVALSYVASPRAATSPSERPDRESGSLAERRRPTGPVHSDRSRPATTSTFPSTPASEVTR